MARFLKQSTAFTFRIGPFVDSTDGVTAETALSIGQADMQISKAGGAFAQTSAAPTTTHDADGWYQCPLTVTDTGTLGTLTVQIVMAGALPVWEHFMVLPANVYDSIVAGSDTLDVQVTGIGANVITATSINADAITDAKVAADVTIASVTGAVGSVTGAVGSVTGAVGSVTGAVGSVTGNVGGNVTGSVGSIAAGGISEASFATTAGTFYPLGIIDQGTAQSATGTTLVLRSAAGFANDEILGCVIVITGGTTGVGQVATITDYVGATDTATVDTWTTTPSGTITYKILAAPRASTTPPSVSVTHWNGTAVATPTTAGVPEVDVTHVIGDPIVASSAKTTNWGGTV